MSGEEPALLLERTASTSQQEFVHGLEQYIKHYPATLHQLASDLWKLDSQGVSLSFKVTPIAPLTIASIRLPRCQISISGLTGSKQAQQGMINRLDFVTKRGGG